MAGARIESHSLGEGAQASDLAAALLRQVALELQRWAALHAKTDLVVSKALDRIDTVKEEARSQSMRERRKGIRA